MTDNDRDRMLLEISTAQAAQGAILERLDRDVPALYRGQTDLSDRLHKLERVQERESGRQYGVGSAWSTVRWLIGTLLVLAGSFGGSATFSCIMRP